MLLHAKDYERTEAQSMAILLDELDRVYTIKIDNSYIHWTSYREDREERKNCTFLASTMEAGLRQYVKEKLELNRLHITQKLGRPLLDYAIKPGRKS
jgi:hypothetical protein